MTATDAKALETLGYDTNPDGEFWLLSCDLLEQQFGNTKALYWQDALNILFHQGDNSSEPNIF